MFLGPWSLEGDAPEKDVKGNWPGRMMTLHQRQAVVGWLGKDNVQGDLDRVPHNGQDKAAYGLPQLDEHK